MVSILSAQKRSGLPSSEFSNYQLPSRFPFKRRLKIHQRDFFKEDCQKQGP